jgi:hypothetical protein
MRIESKEWIRASLRRRRPNLQRLLRRPGVWRFRARHLRPDRGRRPHPPPHLQGPLEREPLRPHSPRKARHNRGRKAGRQKDAGVGDNEWLMADR